MPCTGPTASRPRCSTCEPSVKTWPVSSGVSAEALVYLYASCDRAVSVSADRASRHPCSSAIASTTAVFVPEDESLFASFMELTFANELDISRQGPEAGGGDPPVPRARSSRRCRSLVSAPASAYFRERVRRARPESPVTSLQPLSLRLRRALTRDRITVHLHALCWNEERLLPYFFRHYDDIVDRYYVYNHGSTDRSVELLSESSQRSAGPL